MGWTPVPRPSSVKKKPNQVKIGDTIVRRLFNKWDHYEVFDIKLRDCDEITLYVREGTFETLFTYEPDEIVFVADE